MSAFEAQGMRTAVAALVDDVSALYREDAIPWVVGYSGGKDSTAVLMLVWKALASLAPDARHKPVYVISTDTLVENPVVARWVANSLEKLDAAAKAAGLPVEAHRLTPEVRDTFWVNLIGKGYPAPRPKFRWCTKRLKIQPSNRFIRDVVRANGEAIVVLGTRKAESRSRALAMQKWETHRLRDRLSPNGSLPNSLVFSPIEDWTNDDVWRFLTSNENPWGHANTDLLTMYAGATEDGECPLVVDDTTPSCGDSRFGCWTCTMVQQDRSMAAMIRHDDEKEWMLPLLELRNALDISDDRHLRDYRRMNGSVQLFHGRPIPGPYTQTARADWLRRLLEIQTFLQTDGPAHVRDIELIQPAELEEIRRIWVIEKHEVEDLLPEIYLKATGEGYPGAPLDDAPIFGQDEMALLRAACREEGDDDGLYALTRELLDIEWRMRTKVRRNGLFEALEASLRRNFYAGQTDAIDRRTREGEARRAAADGHYRQEAQLLVTIDEPQVHG